MNGNTLPESAETPNQDSRRRKRELWDVIKLALLVGKRM